MNNDILTKYYLNCFETKKSGSDISRLSMTLFNSKIRLTPHQIDAALFAFKSPINKGVILADEVGLGKTIEAGIIIAQLWYEKRARILIIAPASLMRQWNNELLDKFMLDSTIMDGKKMNYYLKKGYTNPFDVAGNIVICSYQYASSNAELIRSSNFDTVIIDEAHKLRNAYTGKSITCNNIKYATENLKKILLTATPIQNSLMDIYGITSFIDDDIFGDKDVFRLNYIKNFDENNDELKSRLNSYLHRTLRNQVSQYIKYTNRNAKTFNFIQTQEEQEVYKSLQEIILDHESNPYIIPKGQSHLLLLILSKLMGSSIYALQGTLEVILNRLKELKNGNNINITEYFDEDDLMEDYEIEEFENIEDDNETIDYIELEREIALVSELISKTKKISKESKYYALLESLKYSFKHLKEIGANEKVLIFTESTRTQDFLYKALKEDGYDNILLFNGGNKNEDSKKIYDEWLERPENADKKENARSVNMRSAIIDKFSKDGEILISTEAGAEGLNLQFCSLIVNYDLPWNPQRVEQRIGRCHRFGQKHDVTVINFINSSNKAEQRIYELLSTKFNLFNQVFGASDEILGKLESENNIERAISDIYRVCRTEEEIEDAFNKLQAQFSFEIDENLTSTKQKIIDNFEEDLQQYFSDMMLNTEKSLNDIERTFWNLTKLVLKKDANFDDENYIIHVHSLPEFNGKYKISSRNENNNYMDYNSNTGLGKYVLEQAKKCSNNVATVRFDITNYPYKLSEVENLKGTTGIITFNKYHISSFEDEDYLFFSGMTKSQKYLDNDIITKIFRLDCKEDYLVNFEQNIVAAIQENVKLTTNKLFNESSEKNNSYLNNEIIKINNWADDKIQAIQHNAELMREQRKELRKQSDLCTNTADKLRIETEISKLTSKISKSWMEIADIEEEVEETRKNKVEAIKKENMKSSSLENIFTIEFEVV